MRSNKWAGRSAAILKLSQTGLWEFSHDLPEEDFGTGIIHG